MTRFVAALLVAVVGEDVRAAVDPCTPGTAGLGPYQEHALLAEAFARGRRQRQEGMEIIRRAGGTAWRIHQQQGGTP